MIEKMRLDSAHAERRAFFPVAGRSGKPLARRPSQCLAGERLAPALELLKANGSRSFMVWRDGAVEAEWYADDFTPDLRLESASMHKSVMALAVGAAIARGRIRSVSEPVSTWLTEWRGELKKPPL